MKIKQALIVGLVALNLGLLAWVLTASVPAAKAQAFRGGADFIAATGKIGKNTEAIYIIDLGKRKMLAWKYDDSKRRMQAIKGVDLSRDFKRDEKSN